MNRPFTTSPAASSTAPSVDPAAQRPAWQDRGSAEPLTVEESTAFLSGIVVVALFWAIFGARGFTHIIDQIARAFA